MAKSGDIHLDSGALEQFIEELEVGPFEAARRKLVNELCAVAKSWDAVIERGFVGKATRLQKYQTLMTGERERKEVNMQHSLFVMFDKIVVLVR